MFRHVVSNLADVVAAIRPHSWPVALGGHIHLREVLRFGSPMSTRFEQAAAIVSGSEGVVPAISGVTLYTVRDGRVDVGEFLPLDQRWGCAAVGVAAARPPSTLEHRVDERRQR